MMETKIEVPVPVRELVAIGIDNAERALGYSSMQWVNRLRRPLRNRSPC